MARAIKRGRTRRGGTVGRRRKGVLPAFVGRRLDAATDLLLALGRQYSGYAKLMRLDRPIGIWLLLWPTLWALWLAAEGRPSGRNFLIFVLGVLVMRSAGCVINDFADRKLDGAVARTKSRPLVTGEVSPAEALALFVALMLIAAGLALSLNPLCRYLALAGAVLTVLYPFCKRFISTPQFVLGVAFGWAVPMAFAAELEHIPRLGWLMFISVVVWAIVYDTQYAMADREDDKRVGIRSTAILFGDADRFIVGLLQLTLLLSLYLIGDSAGLGLWYMTGLAAAACFALYQQILLRDRDPDECFKAFTNNHYFGAAIFIGIFLDYTLR